ncbi:hypothetical protein P154DRAFT_542584 [Amniculicola lignicola CBS 123094]|uniref:RING-type domain-containing protein n=1 Tax=Amniculicola lignicola CBS 123094 TaxID=1392246 RepID=A0A6A5WV83_9PLEO|nr:hypothetical protein P154DRAFT_542584 [Amniculicola lignicola CBS 123094]
MSGSGPHSRAHHGSPASFTQPTHHPNHRDPPNANPRSASQRNSPFQHFDDAFPPSPPAYTNFLDTILNPTHHPPPNALPFGYAHPPLYIRSPSPPLMASSRPSRLPNGYVDLTSTSESPAARPTRKRRDPEPGPSTKRQRRSDGAADSKSKTPELVEEIDMTDGKADLREVLQKQRADAVKSQQKPEEKATTFNTFTCVICMDTPTDITATSCGHLFCHTCLMEALIAGENRSGPNEPKRSQCPVCRKIINRQKTSDIIPLLLKKGAKTQPRKSRSSMTSSVTETAGKVSSS